MWIGLLTGSRASSASAPKNILGPFDTKQQAEEEVENGIRFKEDRGFVFEATEVILQKAICEKCEGHGSFSVGEWEGHEFRRTGPNKKCETCDGTGKITKS